MGLTELVVSSEYARGSGEVDRWAPAPAPGADPNPDADTNLPGSPGFGLRCPGLGRGCTRIGIGIAAPTSTLCSEITAAAAAAVLAGAIRAERRLRNTLNRHMPRPRPSNASTPTRTGSIIVNVSITMWMAGAQTREAA